MKKLTKTLFAITCVAALGAGVCAMAACGDNSGDNGDKTSVAKTGAAYSLSHKGGYVAYSTVTVKDNKITDVTLTEVELPSQISFSGTSTTSAEDAVSKLPAKPDGMTDDDFAAVVTSSTKDEVTTYTVTAYYKTVSYGDVTMIYDTEAKTYKVGTQTIAEYFQTEANCKTYYEAVIGNKISVTAGTSKKDDLLTKAVLSKEENGYWMCDKQADGKWNSHASAPYSADAYSRWKWNRDATVAYVKANGVEGLLTLKKATEKVEDNTNEKKQVNYWEDSNGVSTGATWSDLWYDTTKEGATEPTAYLTYARLITKAYNAAK